MGLFRPLIAIPPLDFMPAGTPKLNSDDRYIVKGDAFGVIWAADFNNAIKLYVRRPVRRPRVTRRPTKIFRKRQIYRYGYLFWGYLGR